MGVECSRQRKHHKQDPDLFGKTRDQYAPRETSEGESGVRHGVQPCGALQVLARSWYNSEYMQGDRISKSVRLADGWEGRKRGRNGRSHLNT